jgi:formate dehydrogenase beta subunit
MAASATISGEPILLFKDIDEPGLNTLGVYEARGGYESLRKALQMSPEEVLAQLEASGLRGRGGAGFSMGKKVSFLPKGTMDKYLVCNADESEPGTFKDRELMQKSPHMLIEGIAIASYAAGTNRSFIYIRGEYVLQAEMLDAALAEARDAGYIGERILGSEHSLSLVVHRGAGAYICGEESSLMESIEGKRGLPRHKPPFPFQVGLFGRPTLINNIETLYWIRDLIERGAAWWKSHGRNGRFGLRSYSVSGRVKDPGMKLAPAGLTIQELIDEFCGGMSDGHRFAAYLPGGASGGILPASMNDIPLDFGTLEKYGCFIGSAAVIVMSDQDDVRGAALNLMRFFEDESCGQCTPCRVGTQKARVLMEQGVWDTALLGELSDCMRDASICGLGQAASNPLTSIIRFFPELFSPPQLVAAK